MLLSSPFRINFSLHFKYIFIAITATNGLYVIKIKKDLQLCRICPGLLQSVSSSPIFIITTERIYYDKHTLLILFIFITNAIFKTTKAATMLNVI